MPCKRRLLSSLGAQSSFLGALHLLLSSQSSNPIHSHPVVWCPAPSRHRIQAVFSASRCMTFALQCPQQHALGLRILGYVLWLIEIILLANGTNAQTADCYMQTENCRKGSYAEHVSQTAYGKRCSTLFAAWPVLCLLWRHIPVTPALLFAFPTLADLFSTMPL